jgi:hypothetical protein
MERNNVMSARRLIRKSDGPEQIELIINTMMKYGMDGKEKKRKQEEE